MGGEGGEGGAGTVHFFIHRQVYSIALELEVREAACQQAGGGGGVKTLNLTCLKITYHSTTKLSLPFSLDAQT